ncbi:YggS family pyridoxal phosphate-dependent enzyme [Nonomuraea recticatena]|uniref:Pyridoxal phosphate homeostasis protein n=1 Tax=Nonomuraea recticatena TaxID=46178 RepID=A0ABN3RRJ3_9ACTN
MRFLTRPEGPGEGITPPLRDLRVDAVGVRCVSGLPGFAVPPQRVHDGFLVDIARKNQIAAGLAEVEKRIAEACRAAGRPREEVTLIAVTKTYPAEDVRILAGLGVTEVGENRDQEAADKALACADLPLTWHFVGQLQTNKVRSVVGYADLVHSVDRSRLVAAIGREAVRAEREIGCLVQVALDDDPGRGGARPADVLGLADEIAATEGVRLGGLMAVAPLGEEPGKAFARLRDLALAVQAGHPGATIISAGMSGDLAEAVAHGATHVRVGTALLGRRKPFVR